MTTISQSVSCCVCVSIRLWEVQSDARGPGFVLSGPVWASRWGCTSLRTGQWRWHQVCWSISFIDWLWNCLRYKMVDWLAGWFMVGRLIDCLGNWMAGWLFGILIFWGFAGWFSDFLVDQLIGWLFDFWLVGWFFSIFCFFYSFDWLVDWLADLLNADWSIDWLFVNRIFCEFIWFVGSCETREENDDDEQDSPSKAKKDALDDLEDSQPDPDKISMTTDATQVLGQ